MTDQIQITIELILIITYFKHNFHDQANITTTTIKPKILTNFEALIRKK